MNIRLQGERLTQRNNGTAMKPDYVKVRREFVCVAEGSVLRELSSLEEIHIKDPNATGCISCGHHASWMVHYEFTEVERWIIHPKRCNVLYIP